MTPTRVPANPAKMMAKGAPHVIPNDDDEEREAYSEALFKLTAFAEAFPF
jgi:hypothetical protein